MSGHLAVARFAGARLDWLEKWRVPEGQVMGSRRQSGVGNQDELRLLRERVKQLEQENAQLRTSEERLQILFEHAPDAYYLSDLKGTFVDGNAAAERITGYMKGELVGESFLKLKLLSAGDLLRAASLLAKNLLGRSTGPDEFTLTSKDGTPVPVEIQTHPVRIGNRRLVLGIARDISARKKTEHELRERARELQGLYRLAEIAERKDVSLDELYQELTDILPSSWQHEEITCARIVMGEREFRTANFAESPWKQSAPVRVKGVVTGAIEVSYLDERSEEDEGPFLKEERMLINALAERVGRITERMQADRVLRASEERYHTVFEEASDGLAMADAATGTILDCNAALCRMVERGRAELVGQPQSILHPPQDRIAVAGRLRASGSTGDVGQPLRETLLSKGGKLIPVEIRAARVELEGRTCLLGVFRDVSERNQFEEQLVRMARRDPLTGVLNRYALEELLEREASRSERYDHPVGFLMIDVNRFKEINDRFGHAMGDKVLQAMAAVIQHNIRDADILVRYGGDEFLVVLPEASGDADLVRDRILAEVAGRNRTNPLLDFPVTLAMGSARWSSGNGQTMEQALAEADRLMYEDKRKSPPLAVT
jgi:diguanylate cyclase (GGDEF)-like protein/PAS domain S-box-containing protein